MQSLKHTAMRLYSTVPKSQLPDIITKQNSLHVSLILHNPNKKDFVNLHKLLFDSTKIYENKLYYVLDSSKFIHYSTSFFIKHIVMDEATIQKHVATVLASKNSFSKLEITTVTENKDATDKGFMVVVDVTATNNADLTNKIIFLLNELNIPNVNYNSVVYKTQDFKF